MAVPVIILRCRCGRALRRYQLGGSILYHCPNERCRVTNPKPVECEIRGDATPQWWCPECLSTIIDRAVERICADCERAGTASRHDAHRATPDERRAIREGTTE